MCVALLPIIAIRVPLARVVPLLGGFRVRSRIFRWYGQLRMVENAQGRRRPEQLQGELDAIEQKVASVKVPPPSADVLYALCSHIQLVRRRRPSPPAVHADASPQREPADP